MTLGVLLYINSGNVWLIHHVNCYGSQQRWFFSLRCIKTCSKKNKVVPLWELTLQVICVFRSRQSWSLSVEKQRSSWGPECLVRGGAFLRGSPSDDRCFLLSPPPSPFPPPSCDLLPSLNGLWTEFQCISSFFGCADGKVLELASSPSLLLLAEAPPPPPPCGGIIPAAAASADWCVGLPIIVIANGSSEEMGGGRLRSRFLSLSLRLEDDDEEEEEVVGSVLVSFRATENGSPRRASPLPSWAGRGGGRVQASERFNVSWATVLSKAARKGSSGGMCLQFHTDDSNSGGGRDWEKAGNRIDDGSMSVGTREGRDGATDQMVAGSSCGWGLHPGEWSRKAERKGSTGRPSVCVCSLLCDTGGQAAQPAGSGEGPRVWWDGESRPESSTFSGDEESDEKAASKNTH